MINNGMVNDRTYRGASLITLKFIPPLLIHEIVDVLLLVCVEEDFLCKRTMEK